VCIFLNIYVAGRINIDTIIEIEGHISPGMKYTGKLILEDLGGTATNIATAIKRYDRSHRVFILGSIGKDYKDYIFRLLESEGIECLYISIADSYTGRAYIFINSSRESTIVTLSGANDLYSLDKLSEIHSDSIIVIANTQRAIALKLIDIANNMGLKLFLDPGKSWMRKEDLRLIKTECFFLPNIDEFRYLFNRDIDDIQDIDTGRCIPIVKMGPRGSMAINWLDGYIIKISSIPIERIGLKPMSTAGCGDTFTGVFIASYIETNNIIESLKRAIVAASIKMSRISSRDSPYRDEIERILQRVEQENLLKITIRNLR